MPKPDFAKLDDISLAAASFEQKLGISRALAIEELAKRALNKPELLPEACKAIAIDRRIGFHAGFPVGWLGADLIFLSGQDRAIRCLLSEMDAWEPTEQEDLVRHWAEGRAFAR